MALPGPGFGTQAGKYFSSVGHTRPPPREHLITRVDPLLTTMAASPNDPEQPRSDVGVVRDLYARYRKELRDFFVRRGRPQEADDLLQVMFLDLVRRPPPKELRNAQAYLFSVAWTTLHDMNRRDHREPPTVPISDMPGSDTEGSRSLGLWQEDNSTSLVAQAQLNRALSKLPAACQVAVIRQYRDGWTYQQIAQELNVTVHAVKKYISKSLRHFAEHFSGEDEKSSVKNV
jgi:RNA polymerase sigma factor (sigma-70 family)